MPAQTLRLALAGLVLTTTALAQEPAGTPAPTGRITGRVVTDAGLPVVGASIVLMSSAGTPSVLVQSDGDGSFDFQQVPSGESRLLPSKPGLQVARSAGRVTPSYQLTLRPGQHLEGVTLTLVRGGAIVGRVVDEFGEPVQQVHVAALRRGFTIEGNTAPMRTGEADISDDRGEFRVWGLTPGEHMVMAATVPESRSVASSLSPLSQFAEVPVYYPGTPDPAHAQVVVVDAAQDVPITLVWRPIRAARISGVVVSSSGAPTQGRMLLLVNAYSSGMPFSVGAGGNFSIEGVGPGDYLLAVRAQPGGSESGSVPVTVGSSDITGLVVVTTPPTLLRGRVRTNGPRPSGSPIRMVTAEIPAIVSAMGGDPIQYQRDGQFTASGTGRVFFEARPGWSIRSMTVDGEDVLDEGIDLTGRASVDNINIELTTRLNEVTARVASEGAQPLDGMTVVVLRLDAGRVPAALMVTRATTDIEGRASVRGLRRGSYVAAAFDALTESTADPEFQQRVRDVGERFSLDEGSTVTLNLRPVDRR